MFIVINPHIHTLHAFDIYCITVSMWFQVFLHHNLESSPKPLGNQSTALSLILTNTKGMEVVIGISVAFCPIESLLLW